MRNLTSVDCSFAFFEEDCEIFFFFFVRKSLKNFCADKTTRVKMNGTTSVVGNEVQLQRQHPHSQNDTSSEHPRSPSSPLSIRHGQYIDIGIFFFFESAKYANFIVLKGLIISKAFFKRKYVI